MAHMILNNKFYALRTPAWHGLGEVGQDEESVDVVATRVGIPYVTLCNAGFEGSKGFWYGAPGYNMIVGYSTDQDGYCTSEVYGAVTDQYSLYNHNSFLSDWQQSIPTHCETLGVLKRGEVVFVTVQLPAFGMHGDEMAPYLLGVNTTDGMTSVQCRTTLVRVVCQNTLSMALGAHTDQHIAVNHTSNPAPRVRAWLQEVWAGATGRVDVLREAAELLASRDITPRGLETLCETIYPTLVWPDTDDLDRLAAWEKANRRNGEHRENVSYLFDCSDTVTRATRGNLWGAYNAVCEYEDFGKARTTAMSRFMGEAAKRKEKAFDVCMSLAH